MGLTGNTDPKGVSEIPLHIGCDSLSVVKKQACYNTRKLTHQGKWFAGWELLTKFRNEVRISRFRLDMYVQVPVCYSVTPKHPNWCCCSRTDLFGRLNSGEKCVLRVKMSSVKGIALWTVFLTCQLLLGRNKQARSLVWYFLEKDAMHSIQTAKSRECQTTSVESFHLLSHRGW